MSIPKLKSLIEQPVKKISKIAGVVLKSEGEVLLTKRSEVAGKYPNFWAVPMGHVEENESFKEGAAREFKEETMLDIDSNSLVYLSMLKDSNYNRVVGLYMIELPNKPEPTLDKEHSEWGYYDVKSLPTPMEKNLRIALELKT
tara:strand:+ start:296 stop:724 length:429 start_codon:yes stop_codon:yes gene_type:complete